MHSETAALIKATTLVEYLSFQVSTLQNELKEVRSDRSGRSTLQSYQCRACKGKNVVRCNHCGGLNNIAKYCKLDGLENRK